MKDQYQYFVNSIPAEEETLRTVRYVIGRTRWDKSCALAINPNLKYFHCNEIIRAPFYSGKWSLDACEKHSVYISQAHYPIKGAHMLYQALGKVRRKYPDVKLYIGGWPQTHEKNPLREIMMNYMSEYRGYLHTLARKNHLLGHIFYIGPLDENQVKTQLLRTHVYVSSSSIENESNSLSEAKLLGVPCVSSCVGGVADRLVDGKDGYFYDFYDIDALANHICTLFENRALDEAFSKEARKNAAMVNDIANNADTM
ncbi:MAG: glycosyltransferase, partial [Ruthenibacterium sp.]